MRAGLVLVALSLAVLALALFDRVQKVDPVLRVYPLIGRLSHLIRRAVKVAHAGSQDVLPFSGADLQNIQDRARGNSDVTSFGADLVPREIESFVDVTILPSNEARVEDIRVRSQSRETEVTIPVLNFGALGLGPVSAHTVEAIGVAAARVGCLANTGEDGLTKIHLGGRGDLLWQIGTGYWTCRNPDGSFSPSRFAETASSSRVKMIELKLSQGAKPGMGGHLPAAKNSKYVANLLGVSPGIDVVSPPRHSAFGTLQELLVFLKTLEELAGGKPVGIKMCVGSVREFTRFVDVMKSADVVPAFFTIDGGEGGTGGAPRDLQNYAGLPARQAVSVVNSCLTDAGLRHRTTILASGRVRGGFDIYNMLCNGADGCLFTRAPMVAMGCVQARRCHLGTCPSGIATHHWWRRGAISPEHQGEQLARYYSSVLGELEALLRASDCDSSRDLSGLRLVGSDGFPVNSQLRIGFRDQQLLVEG